jgi:Sulfotransferase family
VKPCDYIYFKTKESWNSAPIVTESHKLVFFTIPKVGCTVWKQLFWQMSNITDWKSQDFDNFLPHNPQVNGLKYLYDYSVDQASEMMTSIEWTKAIMVRNPKEQFLSAFLDKSVQNYHRHIIDRCCPDESWVPGAKTINRFLELCSRCDHDHWRPQND